MEANRACWDKNARYYDFVIRKDWQAYVRIIDRTKELVAGRSVLEAGTGAIALSISSRAGSVLATDFSPAMIEVAKRKGSPKNVVFEVADATDLPYEAHCFDAVVISNCLHIMPHTEQALRELRRVLKSDGMLIAPNFCHRGSLKAGILQCIGFLTGFRAYSVWTSEEYIRFLEENGFRVTEHETIRSGIPIELAICKVS